MCTVFLATRAWNYFIIIFFFLPSSKVLNFNVLLWLQDLRLWPMYLNSASCDVMLPNFGACFRNDGRLINTTQITSWPPQYHFPFIPLTLKKIPLWFIYFIYWFLSLSSTKATVKRVALKRNEVHSCKRVLAFTRKEKLLHEKFAHLSSGHNKLQELPPPGESRQEKGKGIEQLSPTERSTNTKSEFAEKSPIKKEKQFSIEKPEERIKGYCKPIVFGKGWGNDKLC